MTIKPNWKIFMKNHTAEELRFFIRASGNSLAVNAAKKELINRKLKIK